MIYNKSMKTKILIMPKEGILDPQGRALKDVLVEAGFEVNDVRIGKVVEIETTSTDKIKDIVENYILNPLIEDYQIL